MKTMSKAICANCGSKILRETYDKNSGFCDLCKMKSDREQRLKEHMAKPGCPSCDGQRTISFNWELANKSKDYEICKYPKYLKFESALRIGQLYRCPYCEQRWYLDGDSKFMSIIPGDRLQYIEKWNTNSLKFSDEELVQLKAIGATPPDSYGNGKGVISIPCEITDKAGNNYKKAIIRFQSGPPIDEWQKRWHFSDEIVTFRPSEFCLNQYVRVASSQSKEIRMGFAPTKVQDAKGNQYLLNWTTDFVDYNGIKGKDIILSKVKTKEMPPIIGEAPSELEYFIADYSKDLEFLYISSCRRESPNKLLKWINNVFSR